MKVTRINILEFLKIFQDLAGKSDSDHHGRRTRFPASSDRALTFQISRSHLQESKYAPRIFRSASGRRKRAEEAQRRRRLHRLQRASPVNFKVADSTS